MYKVLFINLFFSFLYPCAVCYGAPDHPVTEGINNAIMFLLATITFVLLCIVGSIFTLMKRARAVEIKRSSK
ncbi:MAG: hypothetical protein CMG66_04040 [Candidatus Marinimicrobia bacterium]|nr:hypothetical protein [Candidatus Neomarinimicrobiota bacterium]|tara:strand:- start:8168 stop:8383 length:216 start_codon:yes stop_codon:yes gene_type:complete